MEGPFSLARDGPYSRSVLGFRPFTLALHSNMDAATNEARFTSATATTTRAVIPTAPLRNPHLASNDSPTTSVLTIVLPTLFGALLVLGIFIGVLACLRHRALSKKIAPAKLRKRQSGEEQQDYDPSQWRASPRREMAQVEFDDIDRRASHSISPDA